MACLACGAENRAGRRFCAKCGAPLPVACASCGFANEPRDAFCGGCGADLVPPTTSGALSSAAAEPASPGPAAPGARTVPAPGVELDSADRADSPAAALAPTDASASDRAPSSRPAPAEGERRQVTVLFADMKGYTPLSEKLGEEGVFQLMNRVYAVLVGVVNELGGTVQELTGDGILALFGAPRALEDAPLRACRAALAIQRRMRDVSADLEAAHGLAAQVRIGINAGPVVVAPVGSDERVELKAIGDTVNVAARLESMAEPGTALLSEATHALVADLVEAVDLGAREMKGKSLAQRVYRLERLRQGADRFERSKRLGLTPLVGRARELEALGAHWQAVRAGGWRAVHVVGEAGIGKTRVVHELRERLGREGALVLAGHCSATGATTAFLPFIEVMRQGFRIGAEDAAPAAARKVSQGLALLGIEEARALPYFLNLLGFEHAALRGLDGEIIGVHTREALGHLVRERCRLSPTLLILDDVHWIDRASEQLVEQLMDSAALSGLFLVCTQRPEYRAPWAKRRECSEMRLQGLTPEALADLVRRCAGPEGIADDLVASVLEATGGNPLYAEEMSRYLVELAARGAGATAAGPAPRKARLQVPSSLQGLVMARVDQLGEAERRTLQVAAVVGRRFRLDLVAPIAALDGQGPTIVHELEALDLVVRDDAAPDAYAFRHVLLQETIYQSLLTPRRRELHRQVGEGIERLYGDRLVEWVDALAHHFAQTDDTRRTVTYLARAGEKSLRVYALEEADERFRRAVALIDEHAAIVDDATLADILVRWAHVHYYRRDFRGQVELVERYLPRIEALASSRARALLLFWLSFGNAMRWRLEPARARGEQALALAEAMGDEECAGYACMGLLYTEPGSQGPDGRRRVERLAARALEVAARRNDVYLASKALWGRALDHLLSGRIGESLRDARAVVDMGREAGDPRTIAMGLWGAAIVLNVDGRPEEGLDLSEEALRVSPDPLDRMSALAARGGALVLLGRAPEALAILADVRRDMIEREFVSALAPVESYYGLALVLTGRFGEGTRWIEDALRRFERWGSPRSMSFGHMVLGEIYLQVARGGGEKVSLGAVVRNLGWMATRAPFAERHARASFETTIRIARQTGAHGIEAWALLDLALLGARRRRPEAVRQLEEAERLAAGLGSSLMERKIAEARALLR